MNIISAIRERIRAVIAAVVGSILFCICGTFLTFVMAPRQAIEANRVGNLPQMDAASVAAAAAGDDVLITGSLVDNEIVDEGGYVAYELYEWVVTLPDADDDEESQPRGSWNLVETVAPDLNLDVNGSTLLILASASPNFGGNLHEEIIAGEGLEQAEYEDELLPEDSLRLEGLFNGDLLTVLGSKGSTGGIVPVDLFAGDRVAFEQSEVDAAKGLLFAGICFMVFAPIVLVGGFLGAIFGRRRR